MKSGKETPVWEGKCKRIRKVPVEQYALMAFCRCGGEMVWVAEWNDMEAAAFERHEGNPHKCEECGKVEYFDRLYPDVITEYKLKGKNVIYNSGKIKDCDCED